MANTVLKRTILDGQKNVVIHIYLASDGASGNLTNEVVVDASALDPVPEDLAVVRVQSDLSGGFTGTLSFDATTNVPFYHMNGNEVDRDFSEFGGITNNAGTGKTGDILLTTTGFTATGDKGTITLYLRKRGVGFYDND